MTAPYSSLNAYSIFIARQHAEREIVMANLSASVPHTPVLYRNERLCRQTLTAIW